MTVPPTTAPAVFARLTAWQTQHGRHDLPWQNTRDPYRVWLSEIMLQQTQVSTVLGYYGRFLQRFPDVLALAAAPLDDVLALWSGLGYYSRARNLHRCAQAVVAEWGGAFPASSAALQTLPGIGPSTAAAIAAFCFGEPISIFDGNVKRVLARCLGFGGDLSDARQARGLMAQAQALLPPAPSPSAMVAYTQGLMDLGAAVCSRTRPACGQCPLATGCVALRTGQTGQLPLKTKRSKRSTQAWWWLVARRPDGAVWLGKRPDTGIWAELHCFPEFESLALLQAAPGLVGQGCGQPLVGAPVKHVLTHRDLVLTPVVVDVPQDWVWSGASSAGGAWVFPGRAAGVGVPTPVARWLAQWAPSAAPLQAVSAL